MTQLSTPLFWDLHLHGVAGVDFMHADADAMVFACERLGRHGVGHFAPTLLTAEPGLLRDACRRWGRFLSRASRPGWLPLLAARPLGLHLEGPFLNPRMAGAHPKSALAKPDASLATGLVRLSQGFVAIVTLAPELPGALTVTRKLAAMGIRVQMGHTLATAEEAAAAVRAGACGITHLFNAMRTHHRAPGVLAPLARGQVTAELITDGKHLDPAFVLWCWHSARARLYAVSDGCSAVGAPKGARLTLGSLRLRRQGAVAVVAPKRAGSQVPGILAGGATYLTEHPFRLFSGMREVVPPAELLPLFHRLQSRLFPGPRRFPARRKNHFDSRTLRFLGCSD